MLKNNACPFEKENEEQQLILKQALENDKKTQEDLNLNVLTPSQAKVLKRFNQLYQNQIDFGTFGFDPTNPDHQTKLYTEAIVIVMEQIAEGISIEDIKKIAPSLCDFYYSYSKPLLLKYVQDNAKSFNN